MRDPDEQTPAHRDFSNPFAPPQREVEGHAEFPGRIRHYGDATNGQRFANLLLDYLGFLVVSIVCGLVLGVVLGALGRFDPQSGLFEGAWGTIFSFAVMVAYYVILEGLTGRTLGKLITGTRVVDLEDRRPTFGQVFVRTLVRFVPFEPFSCLQGEGWHDTWSKTRVVRLRPSKWEAAQ